MARNPNILFLYQTFVAFLALTFASIAFATAWALLSLQEFRDSKRPGINLREL